MLRELTLPVKVYRQFAIFLGVIQSSTSKHQTGPVWPTIPQASTERNSTPSTRCKAFNSEPTQRQPPNPNNVRTPDELVDFCFSPRQMDTGPHAHWPPTISFHLRLRRVAQDLANGIRSHPPHYGPPPVFRSFFFSSIRSALDSF